MARRVTCPTFVGRELELRRLEEAVDTAATGSQLVLLGGDAGVGKTRLIEEFCTRWRAQGGIAAVGGCVDLGEAGAGYTPLVEVLRGLRSDLGTELVGSMLEHTAPELLPLLTGAHDGRAVRQGAVLAHTVALLEQLGEHSPGLVVVFEDVHWADASTRDLVAFLARNLHTAKVVVVVSYRADDVHRRHPLRPLLAELARSPTVEHLRLAPMSRSELTVLLTGVAGTVPSDGVVDDVMERSDGIPFYAEELWAAQVGSEPLPATLRDAIQVRVAQLDEPVQEALREAAVLGGPFDERLLAVVTGRSVADAADALRQAVAHQILVMDPDGCRFRHALVREVLQDDLLPGERQRLHQAAAAAIEARPGLAGGDEHLRSALLAHHWQAAQDQPRTLAASVHAGIAAEGVGALANAAAHFQRALELWSRVSDPAVLAGMSRAELLVRAAGVVSHAGAPARAVGMVEAALELLGDDAEPEARAKVLVRLGELRWMACDTAGAASARAAAAALVSDRPPSEAQALSLAALGRHQMLVGRYAEAEGILRRALAAADAANSSAARSSSLSGLGVALTKLGRVEEGVEAGRQALSVALDSGSADDIGRAYVNLCPTLVAATRCEEAVAMARAGLEFARGAGTLASDGALLAYGGAEALCCLGLWDDAADLVAADDDAATDAPHGTTGAVIAARVAFWRGQSDLAARHRDRALAVIDAASEPAPEALLCAAQIAARDGRYDEARRLCDEAWEIVARCEDLALVTLVTSTALEIEADRVEATGQHPSRRQAETEAARAEADAVLLRARELLHALGQRGMRPWLDSTAQLALAEAEHARAWGQHDPERWAAVALQWEQLGFAYQAAMARFREADAVLRTRGHRDRAASAARSALATALQLGAAPLAEQVRLLARRGRLDLAEPPATETPPEPDALTDLGISQREREVLGLLALGRTNRQIAEKLFISEKTASVHVSHVMRKLGVGSRIEAGAVAQRFGLGA